MPTSIYDLHDKAFSKVSAYVIAKGGERVATINLKFPADGAGRLWAYVHWIGIEMVRGKADGFGYDKRSAAVADARRKMPSADNLNAERLERIGDRAAYEAFLAALTDTDGDYWDNRLIKAGFSVWQAV